MKFIFKNISPDTIELYDMGFTMDPGQITEVRDDIDTSGDLMTSIASGKIVFLNSDLSESTQLESIAIFTKQSLVEHEKVYSKEEIDQLFADLANSAPGMLDTLNELAIALGNDPDFATTITTQIDQKAAIGHTHALEYSPLQHTHDTLYYNILTIDAFLANKANATHTHSEYASASHDHNSAYSQVNHDHAGVYATPADIAAVSTPIFGSNFAYAERSPALTVTGTQAPTEYLMLSVNVGYDGLYRIGTSYMWAYDSISNNFEAHMIHENGAVLNEIYTHIQEPANSSGTNANIGTDQRLPTSWFTYIPLTAGTHIFRLSLNGSKQNIKASMWDAHIEFWRTQ